MNEVFQDLSPASKTLYMKMLSEAVYENHSDEEGFNFSLMGFTSQERGNLLDLKKKGLVSTWDDSDVAPYLWIEFDNVEVATEVQKSLQ